MTDRERWAEAFDGVTTGAEYMAQKKPGAKAKTPKAPRRSPEAAIQTAIVRHVSGEKAAERLLDGAQIHSHPNESTWNSAKLRGMGILKGITDLEIVARGGQAYFMECKAPGQYLSEDQEAFRDWCRELDVPWSMVDSVIGGMDQLRQWGLLRGIGA